MRKVFVFLISLLFLHQTLSAYSSYDEMRIGRIEIVAHNVPEGVVFDPAAPLARLQSKKGNLFSQTEFDCDLKMLALEYDQVEPTLSVTSEGLLIRLDLWLKPTIRSITFCGNAHVTLKKLNKELGIKAGCCFERQEFITAFNKLKALYIRKGFFESQLSFDVLPTSTGSCVDIQITIDEGRAGRIKKILFYGFDPCEEEEILERMATKTHNFCLSWYTGRGCYHPDMIEHDRLLILNYLQNCGYADAQVSLCIEEADCGGRIILVISANRGECYSIGKISLTGNCFLSRELLWDQFCFGRGSVYSPDDLRETSKNIRDLYGSYGYIDATVDIQLLLRPCTTTYDVVMTLSEGEQFNVGMIRVFGNLCTDPRLVLHENLLCPGEVFDIRKLQGTEGRLLNTGYFSSVNVYAVKSECLGDNYRDVYIEVEETDTGNVSLFFGLSKLEDIFGGIDLTERNFNLAGVTRLLFDGPSALRGSGEFFHAKASIGNRETSYLLQWTKPYFLDTPWILGVDLEKTDNRTLSRGYEVKTYGGNVHGTYICNEYVKYNPYYRARHTRTVVVDNKNPALNAEKNVSGLISAMGVTWVYDSTDSPRRPTCGLRSRLIGEVAGVGGNFEFMKGAYLNTFYYPVCKKGVFKMRGELQFLHTYGGTDFATLPLSERFFVGGETTVRGYRNFIIGPVYGNNEPKGGVSYYLFSEEFQYNLLQTPCVDGFIFLDAGYVSDSEFTLGRPSASAGFGIRFELMRNTPIMVGMGFPFHPKEIRTINGVPQEIDVTQRFFFSMGGCF